MELTKQEAQNLFNDIQPLTKAPIGALYPISAVVAENYMILKRGVIEDIKRRHAKIIFELAKKDEKGKPIENPKGVYDFADNTEEAEKRYTEMMDEVIDIKFATITERYALECKAPSEYLFPLYKYIIIPTHPQTVISEPQRVQV